MRSIIIPFIIIGSMIMSLRKIISEISYKMTSKSFSQLISETVSQTLPFPLLFLSFLFFFFVFSFFLAPQLQAQEVHRNYVGARGLGMGGAQIAIVNDETSLLINPGGLGKLRDSYGTLFDPEVDGSTKFANLYWNEPISDPFDIQKVSDSLKVSPEKYYHARLQIFPSYVVKNFGIGIFGRYILDTIVNADLTTMPTSYYNDLGFYLGYNFRFFDGRLKLGFVVKTISRIEVVKTLNTNSNLDLSSNASEGLGVGYDLGLNLSGPWSLIPTLSAVLRDSGGTTFNAGKGLRLSTSSEPLPVAQDIDVALAIFPIHDNRVRSSFTFEYDKITEAALSQDPTKYMHFGWEMNFSDLIFVRTGMNGLYWTFGLELASENTQIQLATYGEEVGTPTNKQEDRRLVYKFAFRF